MDSNHGRIFKFTKDNRSVAMPPPSLELPEVSLSRSSDIDENKERGNWSSAFEFLLSCLSYAVGLGNIWRFPYLCFRNGGGAFLIPYVIMMAFVGLPLFLMELSFGQYASEGPITIWKISPLFQGLGYAMLLMSSLVGIYYNMILAWALFYLLSSFTSHLPWSSCDNWWNTQACRKFDTRNCTAHNGTVMSNGTCIFRGDVSSEEWDTYSKHNSRMASDEYFHNFVLDITEGLHDLGGVRWQLALCLFACWTIVFVCLLRGVKSMGKVVYFTALFPYVVLIILLARGATLEGSYDGVIFYLTPEFSRLLDARVWSDAAMQIFFSLSPCWGGLITLASYNRFHNNCYRDAVVITLGNSATSFFAGFVIFSIVGFMAHEMGVPVDKVAAEGAGLAFIAYPEAVARLPISPAWSILFFTMLLTLGLGTQFTIIETVTTTLVDTWPNRLRRSKPLLLSAICVTMCVSGFILCTKGGMYVLQLMDNYCASFSALIIGFVEVIAIAWVYGAERFLEDIKVMMGRYPFHYQYWRFVWRLVVPIIILFILIFSWIDPKPTQYGTYVYPGWATFIGWLFSLTSICAIPIVAIVKVCKAKGPLMQRLKILSQPTEQWGPKLQMHRMETQSPKHTDSQVPLALPNYDPDGYDYPDDLASKKGDDSSSEFEGLRLSIPPAASSYSLSETGV